MRTREDVRTAALPERDLQRLPRRDDTGLLRARAPGPGLASALLAGSIAVAWCATYLLGGTGSAAPHLFYLPIIWAAERFRWRGALCVAITSGVSLGPLMPAIVATGTPQAPFTWLGRMTAFVVVGLVMAWLHGESNRSIVGAVRDWRTARIIRRGVDRGEFVAYFQPVVDLRTGHLAGFETLCRWQSGPRGQTAPAEFIPVAERTGAINAIGSLMLDEASHQAARWHTAGNPGLMTAVNVSPVQFCRRDFVDQVSRSLAEAGLHPSSLCLEITETAIIRDHETALRNITELHTMGVAIALDDFGTGESSLAYLQAFHIDVIKIDQSFIGSVDLDAKSLLLVETIVRMAHALGAVTVAEGIERQSQLDAVRDLGCDQAQGYLLGRPGPPPQVIGGVLGPAL